MVKWPKNESLLHIKVPALIQEPQNPDHLIRPAYRFEVKVRNFVFYFNYIFLINSRKLLHLLRVSYQKCYPKLVWMACHLCECEETQLLSTTPNESPRPRSSGLSTSK
jgi:hypothetical protein